MKRSHKPRSALALALLTISAPCWAAPDLTKLNDRFARQPRSKGEKARNRKYRG